MDRNAVLQDLRELRAVGLEAAVADADQRGRLLAEDEPGRLGERLAVVVAVDPGLAVEVEDRGLLAGVDLGALDVRQKRPLDHVVELRLGLDLEAGHLDRGRRGLGGGKKRGREP